MADIRWRAAEFEHRPKSMGWYCLSIAVGVVIVVLAAWQKNFLFAFFVVVAEVLVLVWAGETPAELTFSLDEKKLRISDRKEYLLADITAWSILDNDDDPAPVTLTFRNHFRPTIRIMVPRAALENVRKHFAAKGIAEVEHDYSLIESLENFFGF